MNETLKPVIQANLPPRFRETSFRFYEPYIERIAQRFPARIDFDPSKEDLTSETFACRLRDAMLAYIMYRYSSTKLDYNQFKAIHPKIIVSQRDGVIACGSRDALRQKKTASPEEVASPTGDSIFVWGMVESFNELAVLARLASERLLTRRVRLTIPSPLWIDKIYNSFDIDLEDQEDGTKILT